MKKRSSEILKYIIVNDKETISIKELAKKYKISEKTLNRDFEEIDDFLKEINIHRLIFNEENEVLNFNNDEKEIIDDQLLKLFNTFYIMSSNERIDYIITILLNILFSIESNFTFLKYTIDKTIIYNKLPPVNNTPAPIFKTPSLKLNFYSFLYYLSSFPKIQNLFYQL